MFIFLFGFGGYYPLNSNNSYGVTKLKFYSGYSYL